LNLNWDEEMRRCVVDPKMQLAARGFHEFRDDFTWRGAIGFDVTFKFNLDPACASGHSLEQHCADFSKSARPKNDTRLKGDCALIQGTCSCKLVYTGGAEGRGSYLARHGEIQLSNGQRVAFCARPSTLTMWMSGLELLFDRVDED